MSRIGLHEYTMTDLKKELLLFKAKSYVKAGVSCLSVLSYYDLFVFDRF